MMTTLLPYTHCQAVYSSRRIAQRCENRVDLGKPGHVALDGTKLKANAGKHKPMRDERMRGPELRQSREVRAWFDRAKSTDVDRKHQRERHGDEMPERVVDKKYRMERIRGAGEALDAEGRATGKAASEPEAQRHFTDPESQIMRKSGEERVQSYNAQATVDSDIVAQEVSNSAIHVRQFEPMVNQSKPNTGRQTDEHSANPGYWSNDSLAVLARHHADAYIPARQRHGDAGALGRRRVNRTRVSAMHTRLARAGRRSHYRLRRTLPEPAFGQIASGVRVPALPAVRAR